MAFSPLFLKCFTLWVNKKKRKKKTRPCQTAATVTTFHGNIENVLDKFILSKFFCACNSNHMYEYYLQPWLIGETKINII